MAASARRVCRTLQDLNAAGIVPTTFKGCELFERYSNGGSFELMTDVDIIVSKDSSSKP